MDFRLQNEGTISILYADTEAAQEWVDEHIADDAQTWVQNGIVIEHRYVGAIIEGIVNDGLTVE